MNCVSQDPAYSRLKDQLIASTGLAFYDDRDNHLIELIGGRISTLGLRSCSSYTDFLNDGKKGSAEMDFLISRLTIGETYFFRDEEQFAAMRDVILPDILERNRSSKQLRIWSAGCATGAEPYSVAILLARELADQIAGWHISIYATDLNRTFLTRAAEGKFRPWALRSTSESIKRECFSREGLIWTIHPRYKKWILFQHMNLAGSEFNIPLAGGTHFDLILCRNVMIYFAPEVSRRLIGHFHGSLDDEGWLVVGASEYSLVNETDFRQVNADGAKLYQKRELPRRGIRVALKPVATPELRLAKPPSIPLVQPPAEPVRVDIEGLRQLADRGDWQKAAEHGRRLLIQDRLNPEIHFYRALIFENLGILDESERSLRQAIYLDRNFALAHYHLALALKRDGQTGAAARSFGNVLQILAHIPDNSTVMAGPEVTVTGLRELARINLEKSGGSLERRRTGSRAASS